MCVVSMVGDHYNDKWEPYRKYIQTGIFPTYTPPQVSKEEFDSLKKEVENMKELLKRAKIYDEKNNEPDCEIEDKMEFLRKVAKLVDIDLDDVIGKNKQIKEKKK